MASLPGPKGAIPGQSPGADQKAADEVASPRCLNTDFSAWSASLRPL